MTNRSLSRSIALQVLFEIDLRNHFNIDKNDIEDILERDNIEFGTMNNKADYAKELVFGVLERIQVLDNIIIKAAPEWPIDKINNIDRNILRIGLYELLFGDRNNVPPKVAIDEAIELSKNYGGDNSFRFVNGVLGAVYKELGEPQKEESSKNNKLPVDRLVGAIVFRKEGDKLYLGLVHDVFGNWTISKGHMLEGEEFSFGIARILKKEMGLNDARVVGESIATNEYIANNPQGKIKKQVSYYIVESDQKELSPQKDGGIDNAKWFDISEISSIKTYNDIMPIIEKGLNKILELK